MAAAVDLVDVLNPVGEFGLDGSGGVGEAAVASEEVGNLLVNEVDVDASLDGVPAEDVGVDVCDLNAMLIREGAAREG